MIPPNTAPRAIAAGLLAFALVALATVAIANGPRSRAPGEQARAGSAPAQQADPTWPVPPTPISNEQADAIATRNARLYGPDPKATQEGPTLVDRSSPSIENLSVVPSVFIATVEGKQSGLELRRGVLRIYTPLDLRVERVIVDEIDPPAGFQYVAYGGITAEGEKEEVEGMHPPIGVGKRYLFFMVPLTVDGGGSDARYMTVNYAMRIGTQETVEDISPDGRPYKVGLAEAERRIRRLAAKAQWSYPTGPFNRREP